MNFVIFSKTFQITNGKINGREGRVAFKNYEKKNYRYLNERKKITPFVTYLIERHILRHSFPTTSERENDEGKDSENFRLNSVPN